MGDEVIQEMHVLLNYDHADEVAAALVSEDVGENTCRRQLLLFLLTDETPRGIKMREKTFSKFLRGSQQSIVDARLEYESQSHPTIKRKRPRVLI